MKYFSVIVRTTKVAESTSQYRFYYKTRRRYFPVVLGSIKLAQNTFSVLLCTTELVHSTSYNSTSYHKAYTRCFPVLCATKLVASTSQHSTLFYYKVCRKYLPVLRCTTKPSQKKCRIRKTLKKTLGEFTAKQETRTQNLTFCFRNAGGQQTTEKKISHCPCGTRSGRRVDAPKN